MKIKCIQCEGILENDHVNEFSECRCGNLSLEGKDGSFYIQSKDGEDGFCYIEENDQELLNVSSCDQIERFLSVCQDVSDSLMSARGCARVEDLIAVVELVRTLAIMCKKNRFDLD